MDHTDFFATSYAQARSGFTEAAKAAGARLTRYVHPERTGPDDEILSVDVAHLGDLQGKKQLVVISGTHGLEGYAGSAAQIAWLKLGQSGKLPQGVGVLLVHGLNPFGFAHCSRTNENNVDLNRNFVDHSRPLPANPDYGRLHPHLQAAEWGWEFLDSLAEAEKLYRDEYGADALFNARVKGQYTHADGLFYGGRKREWSNLTLERIVDTHLASARQIGLIDWHTGLGDYGQPFFLCFSAPGSEAQRQAALWWGEERIGNARPNGLKRPDYSGLVFHGLERFIGERPLAGAVIEFGTRGTAMNKVQPLDQWLRFRAPRGTERFRQLQADVRDAYVPVAQEWRSGTLCHALEITGQAIAGLANWRDASDAQQREAVSLAA
jgi:hypothetical protein